MEAEQHQNLPWLVDAYMNDHDEWIAHKQSAWQCLYFRETQNMPQKATGWSWWNVHLGSWQFI